MSLPNDSEKDTPYEVLPKEEYIDKPPSSTLSLSSLSYRQGPIVPDELDLYERTVPGFAEQYLGEIIKNIQHDREMDKADLELQKQELRHEEISFRLNHRRSTWGLVAGTSIMVVAIGCATFLGLKGQQTAAVAVVGSVSAIALVAYGTDAYNKSKQRDSDDKKSQKP